MTYLLIITLAHSPTPSQIRNDDDFEDNKNMISFKRTFEDLTNFIITHS